MKIKNVNKYSRTLNAFQFGWLMNELNIDFTRREFVCGEGNLTWMGWNVGKAIRLDGGDWTVDILGETEKQRSLMERFKIAKVH